LSKTEPEPRVVEDVLDEVLSFNYRSLRTLRDIFLRPGHVAATFASGDRATYTPTMRVWFAVVSWLFLLSVIWGGFGELILRSSETTGGGLDQLIVEGRRDIAAMTGHISTVSGLLFVPVTAAFTMLGVLVLRSFRRELSFLQTVQCYFVPVTAMAAVSTVMLVLSAIQPGLLLWAPLINYGVFVFAATAVIRAVFARTLAGVIVKTAALTLVVFALTTVATLITFTIGIIYALIAVPPNF